MVVLVTHAVRLAYYYKAQSNESNVLAEEIADLEGFLELSSDPNNDVFLGGLIADPGDFSEADPAVPLLLPGRWDGIRGILLDVAGPRDYTQAIAWQGPVMTGPTSIPQPAGRPPVNSIWNGRTGSWDPDPTNGPAEEVPEAAKRPRGPTPQGKQWCSSTARWVDKITGGDSHGEEVPEAAKRPRGPTPQGKQWCSSTARWVDKTNRAFSLICMKNKRGVRRSPKPHYFQIAAMRRRRPRAKMATRPTWKTHPSLLP